MVSDSDKSRELAEIDKEKSRARELQGRLESDSEQQVPEIRSGKKEGKAPCLVGFTIKQIATL